MTSMVVARETTTLSSYAHSTQLEILRVGECDLFRGEAVVVGILVGGLVQGCVVGSARARPLQSQSLCTAIDRVGQHQNAEGGALS